MRLFLIPIVLTVVLLAGCATTSTSSSNNTYTNAINNLQSSYKSGEMSEAEYLQRRQEIVSIAIAQEQMRAAEKQAMFNAMMQNKPAPINQNAGLADAIRMRSLMTPNRHKIYDPNGQYLGYVQEE